MKYVHTKQQEEYDCGIACVSSILKYYNLQYGINYLRDLVVTKNGYSLKDLISLFNHFKQFSCKAIEVDQNYIEEVFYDLKMPCIALVNRGEEGDYEGHYIIIYKKQKNKLIISDPVNEKISTISINEFKKEFTGILLLITKKNNDEFFAQSINYSKQMFKELIKGNKFTIISVLLLSSLFVLLSIGNSYFFKILTDFVIPYHYDHFLVQFTLTFLGINLLNNLFDYARIYVTNRAAIKLDKSISTQYLEKIIQLPLVFFENRESGDIISRFNDTSYIRNLVNVAFISLILNSVILLGIGIVLYMINKMLFLIVLCLSLILISLTIIYYDILKKRNRNLMSARSYTQSFLIQFIKNMTSVYSLNKKEYFLNSFHKVFSKQLDSTRKEAYSLTNSNGLKKLVQTTFSIIILFVGAKQIMSDSMTLGDFLFVNSLMMFFMSSLGGLIEIQGEIQKALVAKDRFLDIMNYPVLKETNEKKIASVEEIKIKNLSFYINDQCIIKDINVTLYENEKIILVGESGSGKTTFSRLLNKLYPVSDSQIFINGIDINGVSSTELRNEIIYLNETPFLFKDSIRENLSMGEDFTEDEIIEACKIAQIYDVINSLSNQFNFVINESMSNLSTGQKQRLCLARAILQKPSVLILDESLSNVDLNTFKNIYDRLLELNVILIFITHNPEFLTEYDRKLVFVEKSIIEMEKRNEKMRLEVTR